MERVKKIAVSLVNSVKEVPKDVEDMNDKLDEIQAIIHDADMMTDKMADKMEAAGKPTYEIKAKVKQLVENSFRMEDIIDEYTIHEERQLRDDPGCVALPCKTVDFVKTMTSRLQFSYMNEDVKSEFDAIKFKGRNESEDSSQMQSSGGNQNTMIQKFPMAPLYMEEAEVVGFEEPRDKLIHWLVSERSNRNVISVVGIGGQGKTTLAKIVFDNMKVIQHFRCRAWITVSEFYTAEGLLRGLLHQFYQEKGQNLPQNVVAMDQTSLIHEVRKYLHHNRYVVVFDDVWNESFWDELEFALIDNKNGSRILITTRNMRVAMSCKRSAFVQVHELQPLTLDESLKLFCKKVFRSDLDEYCPDNLKSISIEIVKKCKGLPLAIVAIAGILSCKDRAVLEWQRFSQNLSSELEKIFQMTDVTKKLSLSYHDLPYNLKQCFLYFGIYPEDYKVECVRLIQQWVAEGFVKYKASRTLEEVAEQYLNEFIQRSLVQVSSFTGDGKPKTCRVHDLVRQMILKKTGDLSFCHFAGENGNLSESGMVRRLTIASGSNNWMESDKTSNIRSLHVFRDEELPESFVSSIPTKYRLLKVLDFEKAALFNYVPENLGDLFLLRYLSFRNTKVTNLPISIGMLHNLETLDLRQTAVREMPIEVKKLTKLRHLLAYDTSKGVGYGLQMKDGIGQLTSLQMLREVETNHGGVELIKEIERLTQLRVLGLTNVKQEFRNDLCSLINRMQHMEKLYVTAIDEHEVIDLHFNVYAPILRKVTLVGKLIQFPNWVAKLQYLVTLSLSHSKLTDDPLALLKDLPNLLCLSILYCAYGGKCLHFPNGGFPRLEQIVLRRLDNLNSILIDNGALLSLKKFKLVNIPQLTEVPSGVYSLPKLEVFHAINMSNEFEENFHRNRRQHEWIIDQVPSESIVDRFWAPKKSDFQSIGCEILVSCDSYSPRELSLQ